MRELHVPEFEEGTHKNLMFLSGLSVVNTLLIGYFDEMIVETGWGLTNPRWIGLLSDFLFHIGWYGLFANIIYIVVMTYASLRFEGMKINVLRPTVHIFVGVLLFWIDDAITMYAKFRGPPLYDPVMNMRPSLPPDEWRGFFLVRFIPLLGSALSIIFYCLWMFSYEQGSRVSKPTRTQKETGAR